MKSPCDDKHIRTVHLTPSDPNHATHPLACSAIHAAGGFTPDWSIDWVSVKTMRTEVPDDEHRLVTA